MVTAAAADPAPPPILHDLVEAARGLPPDRRRGPFRGRVDDAGLAFTVAGRVLFLSDADAARLAADDYIDVSPRAHGGRSITLRPRGADARRPGPQGGGRRPAPVDAATGLRWWKGRSRDPALAALLADPPPGGRGRAQEVRIVRTDTDGAFLVQVGYAPEEGETTGEERPARA